MSNKYWSLKIALLAVMVGAGFMQMCSKSDKKDDSAVCQNACYPNPVDRVYGRQCFCKADIVIREMPNEQVPGSR